jgi:electron transfer flavoprotein beta subunit
MANVLVCVKRVPDTAGEVLLSADGLSVDARHVGYTVSPHEECAVELATQVAEATGGRATVLSVGSEDAVEQLRNALAVGCADGVLVETDADLLGPADVAAAIAGVVHEREAGGLSYDLVLLGNDAADTGDFQVPVRLAYALGGPCSPASRPARCRATGCWPAGTVRTGRRSSSCRCRPSSR